ncbi:MAG: hypothetical protein M9948_12750 [Lentimicrobium sp.]|nr:hypothetical protein [Lentimicrobium sp.]
MHLLPGESKNIEFEITPGCCKCWMFS